MNILLQICLQLWRRLLSLLRRGRYEREMEDEMRFHLEMQIEQNLSSGMAAEEARYAAIRSFGGVERVKEESRDARGGRLLEEVWQDLRYGARMLLKHPGFTVIAIITLSLGVGANTAIFSVVNGLFLRALPYRDDARLVSLGQSNRQTGAARGELVCGELLHRLEPRHLQPQPLGHEIVLQLLQLLHHAGIDQPGVGEVHGDVFPLPETNRRQLIAEGNPVAEHR